MKIAVFVDYWNFQISLNDAMAARKATPGYRSKVNWKDLGPLLS